MSATSALKAPTPRRATEIADELGPVFAERANSNADEDKYVADNFALLKSAGRARKCERVVVLDQPQY